VLGTTALAAQVTTPRTVARSKLFMLAPGLLSPTLSIGCGRPAANGEFTAWDER
jgi:hypothetical protein